MSEKESRKQTDSAPEGRRRTLKSSTVRGLAAVAVFVVVGIGLALPTGTGTPSSMGWSSVAALCPLGAIESALGSWAFVPRALIVLAVIVLIVVLVGKAFCAWACPVPHIQNLFKTRKQKRRELDARREAAAYSFSNWDEDRAVEHPRVPLDSRHAVLGGALLSTAIFGFPVFCLVCPIGLTFATFILLWRLVQFNELTGGLLVFPAIVILEVVVLRKWCGSICPLGALLSLISTLNRRFRPKVDAHACLRDAEDIDCQACATACPEHIDPYADLGERSMTECVKCRSCADACPVHAITLPFRKQRPESPEPGDGTMVDNSKGDQAPT